MTDQRLPSRGTASNVDDADLLHVVDVSDTTSHATGTSKKLTWSLIKSTLKTFFDAIYQGKGNYVTTDTVQQINADKGYNRSSVQIDSLGDLSMVNKRYVIENAIIGGSNFVTKTTNQLTGITGDKKLDGDWEYNKTNNEIEILGDLSLINLRYLQSQLVTSNPVENDYADITELLADQSNQTEAFFQYVLDASIDPEISSGEAYYEKLSTSTADLEDYRLLSDSEVEIIRDSNSYRVFKIEFVQDDATPITSVKGGRIGFEYDTGGGLVTAVVFNKRYTDAILKFLDTDVDLKFYNRSTRLYQTATIGSGDWTTVNTHYYRAVVSGNIIASDLTVNDRIENFLDSRSSGGGDVEGGSSNTIYLTSQIIEGGDSTL